MKFPVFSLEGKVALVTGSRRGIGEAIALTFAKAGADVGVADKVVEDGMLQAVADEIRKLGGRSLPIQTDITRETDVDNMVQKMIDEFGKIDILVNDAAVLISKPLLEQTLRDWDTTMDIDLKGYFLCSKAVSQKMIERKQGNIINMASTAAFKAGKLVGAYYVAKAGVVMLTKVLALELVSHNIRVNAIAPGVVRTELERHVWSNPELLKRTESGIPMGRLADPGDIVGAALFLACDSSSYMTGQTIILDGGRSL